MSPVFRHGRLRLYLLKLLDESPRHGYEVIRLLQDRFMGVYAPSPGTIYPRLARLEEEGLVTHDEADGRKVYRITDKGREELRNRSDDLSELEDEITASVRDIAREVTEDVRETVRNLREELTFAARDMHRRGPAPPRGAAPPRNTAPPPAPPRPARPRRAATAPHRRAAAPAPPPRGTRPCTKKHGTKTHSTRKHQREETQRDQARRGAGPRAGTKRARAMVPARAGGPGRREDPAGRTPGPTGTWNSWPATSPGSCGRQRPRPRR